MDFIEFNTGKIKDYLVQQRRPIMEAPLLKFVTDSERLPSGTNKLFAIHFSLFHALYRLRSDPENNSYYLHLDPMRLRLKRIPEPNRCHLYLPHTGTFCNAETSTGQFCDTHRSEHTRTHKNITFDPLYDFYTNSDNIDFGGSKLLQKLMKGVMVYAFKKGEIEKALKFFGLTNPSKHQIQERYYLLAKEYHPDKNGRDDAKMKALNRAYQVLCEIFIL